VVRGRELRGGTSEADGTFEGEARGDGVIVGDDSVALMINVDNAEGCIDGRLVRVGGWAE
jgi:hypothetical protein